ncbi:N-6 DNA methylase [Bacillus sp. NTK074B]|uniref:N-6 DNA methylase n=1 Tax=Bacillus sp. NTK074B TaxID=2802174 RepID=UPI001A8DCCE7|nr:N-6 DNA methylase [Bacillus sp. NTK074B]
MHNLNARYESIINSCFEELRGTFSQEQSFYIILGVATISWINMNERYNSSNLRYSRFLNEYSSFMFLRDELKSFEHQFEEFDGILTGLMDKVFIYKDKSENKKLKNIFHIIEDVKEEEISKFINKLTSIGTKMSGFTETPESIKEIILGIADFERIKSFADYCSGMSGVAVYIFEQKESEYHRIDSDLHYYGEEINTSNYLISKLLMIVNGIENYEINNKDVLSSDDDKNRDLKFDFIVSDFPQVMNYDIDFKSNDSRFKYGVPSRSSADWAFCQNVIHHLNDNGKGVVIGTKGTLVRSNEGHIRRGVLEDDLIESIITLPDNLYEKSSIGTELIIFNKNKDENRKKKILLINASEYGYRLNKNQHAISLDGINKVLEYYHLGIEEGHFSIFVDLEKIKEYNYTLNPREYLDFDALKNTFERSISLKEVAEIVRGVQVSKGDFERLSEHPTHYFLNVKDIDDGRIYYDDASRLTYKRDDWLGKYDIRPNDIILTSKGSTVKVAIVEDDCAQTFISGNLTRIRVDTSKYDPYVLYEFLQSEVGIKMIEGLQTGTTIKLLNTSQLERLEIPMFDIEYMNDIGNDIKRNKMEYERTISEATMRFEDNREELMGRLGWSISK